MLKSHVMSYTVLAIFSFSLLLQDKDYACFTSIYKALVLRYYFEAIEGKTAIIVIIKNVSPCQNGINHLLQVNQHKII